MSGTVEIGVKWGKESYQVAVDLSGTGLDLKTQLFSLHQHAETKGQRTAKAHTQGSNKPFRGIKKTTKKTHGSPVAGRPLAHAGQLPPRRRQARVAAQCELRAGSSRGKP